MTSLKLYGFLKIWSLLTSAAMGLKEPRIIENFMKHMPVTFFVLTACCMGAVGADRAAENHGRSFDSDWRFLSRGCDGRGNSRLRRCRVAAPSFASRLEHRGFAVHQRRTAQSVRSRAKRRWRQHRLCRRRHWLVSQAFHFAGFRSRGKASPFFRRCLYELGCLAQRPALGQSFLRLHAVGL